MDQQTEQKTALPPAEAATNHPIGPIDTGMEIEAVKPLKGDLSKACFDLAGELPRMMQNWPKMTRMGLGRKLEEHMYKLLDSAVVVSNPSVDQRAKIATLESMSSGSDAVLVYLRLGHTSRSIDPKLYNRLSSQVVAIGKQVGGLRKYLERNGSRKQQNPVPAHLRPPQHHAGILPGQEGR